MTARLLLVTAATLALTGCARVVNTLPPLAKSGDPVEHLTLYVPAGLKVQSVDLDAAMFSETSGGPGPITSSTGGRSFVKVYAVEAETGAQYLLIYENIGERQRPVQVIRFEEEAGS